MNQDVIQLNSKKLVFRKIVVKDKEKVFDLFRECEDYFVLTSGAIPVDCEDFFYNLPPEKALKDKYLYGAFYNSTLIAAIDIVIDYPEKAEWIIGLLLIHPKARGNGLGKKLHDLIKEMAISEGAEKLRIGVIEDNTNALAFWNKIGYIQTKITDSMKFGIKESRIVIMHYYL